MSDEQKLEPTEENSTKAKIVKFTDRIRQAAEKPLF